MKRWPTKPLGDVGEFVRGISFKPTNLVEASSAHSLACFRTKNIQTILDDADLIHIPRLFVKTDRQLVHAGDILISTANSNSLVGKCCFVPQLRYPATLGGFIAALRVNKDRVRPRFLYYWLASPSIQERLRGLARQTTNISNLPLRDLAKEPAPIPPLPEQERIVKLLDEADGLRKLRAQADRRTANLIPALFHEMFGDPVANPKGWKTEMLPKIGKLDRGRSRNRPRGEPSLYGGKYPFIQTGDVANANGEITTYTQTYSEEGLAQSRMWPAGTLVVTIAANIGKTAVLTFPACFPDSMVGFVPSEGVAVDYVRACLVTMENRLDEAAPQMAQKNINLKFLSELVIPVPPLPLQKEFAQRVAEIRQLETAQATSRAGLDALFQSMLHRVFNNGEL